MFESINAVVFLRTSGVLFDIEGPMYESALCPMLGFRNGKINFGYLFLVLKLFGLVNSKTSFR